MPVPFSCALPLSNSAKEMLDLMMGVGHTKAYILFVFILFYNNSFINYKHDFKKKYNEIKFNNQNNFVRPNPEILQN